MPGIMSAVAPISLMVRGRPISSIHLFKGDGEISFGIYAASPVDHSFTARFTNMEVSECKWPAWSAQDTGFNQTDNK